MPRSDIIGIWVGGNDGDVDQKQNVSVSLYSIIVTNPVLVNENISVVYPIRRMIK